MRHYEIVLLVHPDQSEQVGAMVDRYRAVVEENGGTVHRQEDWGRRQLAYPIEKIHKAHYLLFNIECDAAVLDQLKNMFKFSDAVIRNLVVRMDRAVTDSSPMMREAESEEGAERGARESRADSAGGDDSDDSDYSDDSDGADEADEGDGGGEADGAGEGDEAH